ncbi:hypothetical protein D3C81_1285380 [compost metagenome]
MADYTKYGRIDVIALDYSQPAPVWVVNELEREPVEGDQVLIGYIEGRKDMPYLHGFLKNKNYTTNFVVVKKNKIKLQLPVFEIGVIDGTSHKDIISNLLDNTKQDERATFEMTPDHLMVHYPFNKDMSPIELLFKRLGSAGEVSLTLPINSSDSASLKLSNAELSLSFKNNEITLDASGAKINGHAIAKVGDSVSVNVNTGSGTITG